MTTSLNIMFQKDELPIKNIMKINAMENMSKTQYLNYLAIDILEKIGVSDPVQSEIDRVESLLTRLYERYNKVSQ